MATPQLKQKGRLLEVKTQLKGPYSTDALVINGLSGSEAVSSLFCFKVELLAEALPEVDVLDLNGKAVSVSMQTGDGVRYFNGIIRRIARGRGERADRGRGFRHYHAEVVPWMWLLTQRAGCRIFQDLTVPEIIKKIFEEYKGAFSDVVKYDDATTPDRHLPLDYCVQYRETDFNFVSRLMEQEGICYYFEHDDQGHKLIFSDTQTSFIPISGKSTILFEPDQGYGEREDVISDWEHAWNLKPGKYVMRDHHFELPADPLEVIEKDGFLEMYDYPGEFTARFNKPGDRLDKVKQEGEKLVRVRFEEELQGGFSYGGSSTCRNFCAGRTFKRDDPSDRLSMDTFILLSVNFSAAQTPDYISGGQTSGNPYHNSFACMPFAGAYGSAIRPKRFTPKPIIAGPQTATVTVKKGEDSWLDKFGRVRVKFHWDRDPNNDETCSCWVRVSQPWAGTNWGAHFWPRVGQEVVIEFLEGDPDRPIITGSVYNPANMPPYKLPDNYTRSGIITRSSKDGASKNFNELRFEDKKDHEQLFMNAERDMDQRVEHDMREFVACNQHLIVGASQFQAIGGEKHEHVKKDHMEKIDGDASRTVVGEHMEKVSKDFSLAIDGDRKENVKGKISVQALNRHEKINQSYALEAAQEIHLKSNLNVVIEGGVQLTIKVGGNFVSISPAGVTIQGTMVLINSGGAAGSGGGSSPSDPKAPKDVKGPQTADDGSKGGAL
ncbi:MAG TPA: type VI secretion system tip protein TssI/VgrG [Terriglobales bacterium]|nr:type VI secretion system tip protein TssI/VgrG [Terriglobales bacterium]